MATIRIPTPLRPYVGGQTTVEVAGDSVAAALEDLTRQYPDVRHHLFEGSALRTFVNVYLNKEDIRALEGPQTPLAPNDALMIIPSIAGGR